MQGMEQTAGSRAAAKLSSVMLWAFVAAVAGATAVALAAPLDTLKEYLSFVQSALIAFLGVKVGQRLADGNGKG